MHYRLSPAPRFLCPLHLICSLKSRGIFLRPLLDLCQSSHVHVWASSLGTVVDVRV